MYCIFHKIKTVSKPSEKQGIAKKRHLLRCKKKTKQKNKNTINQQRTVLSRQKIESKFKTVGCFLTTNQDKHSCSGNKKNYKEFVYFKATLRNIPGCILQHTNIIKFTQSQESFTTICVISWLSNVEVEQEIWQNGQKHWYKCKLNLKYRGMFLLNWFCG